MIRQHAEVEAVPIRVLLVEDSPDDAELILHALRSAGMVPHVSRVEWEEEFVRALEDGPDVVISDVELPEFDGQRALALRNERAPHIPFIVFSGAMRDEQAAALITNGATDYVLKDRMGRLAAAVSRGIEEHRTSDGRRRAEQTIRDLASRWEVLVSNSADLIAVVDEAGCLLFVNDAFARLVGRHPEDLSGEAMSGYVHPDDVATAAAAFAEAVAHDGVAVPMMLRIRTAGVAWRRVEAVGNSRLNDPNIGGVVFNGRDVTERFDAERLVASEAAILERIVADEPPAALLEAIAVIAEGEAAQYQVGFVFAHRDFRFDSVVGAAKNQLVRIPISYDDVEIGAMVFSRPANGAGFMMPDPLVEASARDLAALVARRQITKAAIMHHALHDNLTGCGNRTLLLDQVRRALANPGARASIVLVGIDHFGLVNEALGQKVGDQVLLVLSDRLHRLLSPAETLARVGGDEFAILVENPPDDLSVVTLAERVLSASRQPIQVDSQELAVSVSIGVVSRAGNDIGGSLMLGNASSALADAKRRGRNRMHIFDQASRRAIEDRLVLEQDLRVGIPRGELICNFQPIVNLRTGVVVAAEALVRWLHPTRGLLLPGGFLPLAEQSDMIEAVDRWMLEAACSHLAVPGPLQGIGVSVNAAARELVDPKFPSRILGALERHGLSPSVLAIEVTESAALSEVISVRDNLMVLRRRGVAVHLDDFGTGYSSLSHLHQLPIDAIKIDRTFVQAVSTDRNAEALVVGITAMARALDLQTIGEGVETEAQAEALRGLGVDLAQGYLYCRPVGAEEFGRWRAERFVPDDRVALQS